MRWLVLLSLVVGCDAAAVDPYEPDPSEELDSGVIEEPDAGFEDATIDDVGFDDAGLPNDVGLPPDSGVPSEWSIISAALAARCRGCHNGTPRPRMDVWDRIVGVPSATVPMSLVSPGAPDDSFLLAKITNVHGALCDRVGVTRTRCGRAMPSMGAPLSPDVVERIRLWIANGASRD